MTPITIEAGTLVDVGAVQLRAVRHPLYIDAHPDEEIAGMMSEIVGAICPRCLIAERLDTHEEVLLWNCGGTWSVSRHDANSHRHRQELGL